MIRPTPSAQERDPIAVREMFDRVAPRYDRANHLLSCGFDFAWRRRAAAIVARWAPRRILDVATGSGDLALALQRQSPQAELFAADFSPRMLALAQRKGVRQTVLADALRLPFAEARFDAVTIAFGLRNMAQRDLALTEVARVLSPRGHLLILDFSLPAGVAGKIYRFYLRRCLPSLAALITGEKGAYEYLGASIEKFPRGDEMCQLLSQHGFRKTTAEPLTGGIVTIYCGEKS